MTTAALLLLALAAAPECDPRLAGTFSTAERSRTPVDAAIERSLSKMSPLIRWIARGKLRAATPVAPTVTLALGEALSVSMVGWTFTAPASGSAVRAKAPDGSPVEVSHQCSEGRLIQRLTNEDGTRENRFELSADGQTLTMHTTLVGPRLPEPVRYQLTYARHP